MSPWFIDASVLLASEDTSDPQHAAARRLLEGDEPLATLDLALYEVTNVAVRAWHDLSAARRLQERIAAIEGEGGLVRADAALIGRAVTIANEHEITVYDASYAAGATIAGALLVSCDIRDLVGRGFARLPSESK